MNLLLFIFVPHITNGKLVGAVLAYPVCMSIGGVSVMCVRPAFYGHRKYHNKQLFYVLSKELQRRANIHKIEHGCDHDD